MDIRYYRKMKNVQRLGMIHVNRSYNLLEHCYMTAMLFKHFASLEDVPYDMDVFDIILHHDVVEVETTDLPHPIKNFSPKVKEAWEEIENEVTKRHHQLNRYSDKNIKLGLTQRQFDLFKVCDTIDLLIFVREEIAIGNRTKDILEVEKNCLSILDNIQTYFPHAVKFVQEYEY